MVAASSSRSLQSSCPRYSDLHRGLNPRLSIYPIHLSGNQSIDPSVPINQPIIISLNVTTNEIAPINRSINPINQSVRLIDQSVNPSISQSVNQSINQSPQSSSSSLSLTHSLNPSIHHYNAGNQSDQSVNRSGNRSVNQPINPPINQSPQLLLSIRNRSVISRAINASTQPTHQSINQSLCPIDQSFLSITLTH